MVGELPGNRAGGIFDVGGGLTLGPERGGTPEGLKKVLPKFISSFGGGLPRLLVTIVTMGLTNLL